MVWGAEYPVERQGGADRDGERKNPGGSPEGGHFSAVKGLPGDARAVYGEEQKEDSSPRAAKSPEEGGLGRESIRQERDAEVGILLFRDGYTEKGHPDEEIRDQLAEVGDGRLEDEPCQDLAKCDESHDEKEEGHEKTIKVKGPRIESLLLTHPLS
jgi:hypothetical protein